MPATTMDTEDALENKPAKNTSPYGASVLVSRER